MQAIVLAIPLFLAAIAIETGVATAAGRRVCSRGADPGGAGLGAAG